MLLSLFKVFEYKINLLYFSYNSFDFPDEKRSFLYCTNNKLECDFFYAIKLANSVVNDCLILIANIGVDLFMFKFFGEFSIKKRKISNTFKQDETIQTKNRITKMILINGIIYSVSHFPELIVLSVLQIYKQKLSDFCEVQMTCDKLNEMAEFFNMIYVFSQFFINYTFNKLFKHTFSQMKNKIQKTHDVDSSKETINNEHAILK
jgi:hypothetical protein